MQMYKPIRPSKAPYIPIYLCKKKKAGKTHKSRREGLKCRFLYYVCIEIYSVPLISRTAPICYAKKTLTRSTHTYRSCACYS